MSEETPQPAWKTLSKPQRRIVGVLIEKAKTTPDQYPLSLNGLVNGCNQKSNRSPQMNLSDNQVEDALEQLRQFGAVGEVQGGSRVAKFRHYMKDWLGVSGPELAVMAELLLRGDQTVGDLRGRANRMTNNEIPDVGALRPIVASLIEKRLVVPLTPSGRGQVVTHALYQEDELAALREKYGGDVAPAPRAPVPTTPASPLADTSWSVDNTPAPAPATSPAASSSPSEGNDSGSLRQEVMLLKEEVARLKKEVEDLWANLR